MTRGLSIRPHVFLAFLPLCACRGDVTALAHDAGTSPGATDAAGTPTDTTAIGPSGADTDGASPGVSPQVPDGVALPDGGAASSDAGVVTGITDAQVTLGEGLCAPNDGGTDNGSATRCGCTRRPGTGEDPFKCPQGIGQIASGVIDAGGGSVALQGQQYKASGVTASLTFAADTVAQATSVSITELANPPPAGLLDWSPVYAFDIGGATLAKPALVQVPWSNLDGVVPQDLALYFSSDGTCFTALANAEGNAGFVTVETTAMGYFIAGVARTSLTAMCP